MFDYRSVIRTVPPTAEPVSLLEAKQQLHLDISEDDNYLQSLIAVSRSYAEHYTQRAFCLSQFTAFYNSLPSVIPLPYPPANASKPAVLEARDSDWNWRPLEENEWYFDSFSEPAIATVIRTPSWVSNIHPGQYGDPGCRITWWAGYSVDGENVPVMVKQAILLLTAHYYERRLAADALGGSEVPFGVQVLLDAVKWRFYS